ncbi:MAG: HAD family phosphatase [Roseibium sp.]|uniref:HAD family hydrolase n=1 Tax=Roseibium sp. TaxID=1936156 RepID=UPI001B187FDB|nr:HAD family phosphatase [Roseibium sp.]MBO6511604.1 HAD family phosphatase [Roseibium sp.]MBO6890372.1 HAD family phosphatase [Roseibium sp.]MBO6929187.1 HAD family phosphatase [Roseibium sp.]
MVNSITTVVFDIGNVLIEWNPDHLYRKLIPDTRERDVFLQTVCSMEWNIQQDLGRSWSQAVEILVKEHPDKADLIAAYSDRWHEMVPGEVPGTRQILEELKQDGTPLYAITNFSAEKFSEAQDRFPFLKSGFRDIVVSAEERLIKPDPKIYKVLLERNGLEPASCYFIDDSERNAEAARSVGMSAHHFKTADLLRDDLVRLGLLKA